MGHENFELFEPTRRAAKAAHPQHRVDADHQPGKDTADSQDQRTCGHAQPRTEPDRRVSAGNGFLKRDRIPKQVGVERLQTGGSVDVSPASREADVRLQVRRDIRMDVPERRVHDQQTAGTQQLDESFDQSRRVGYVLEHVEAYDDVESAGG